MKLKGLLSAVSVISVDIRVRAHLALCTQRCKSSERAECDALREQLISEEELQVRGSVAQHCRCAGHHTAQLQLLPTCCASRPLNFTVWHDNAESVPGNGFKAMQA